VLVGDNLLKGDDLGVGGRDNSNDEVEHDNQHEEWLRIPGHPDQEDVQRSPEAVLFGQDTRVYRHSKFTDRCSEGLEYSFLEEGDAFCFYNFRVDLHVQHNKANREDKEEGNEANNERYEVNDAELNHLHQETVALIDSYEEKHLHERHQYDHKLELWYVLEVILQIISIVEVNYDQPLEQDESHKVC